MKLSFQEVAATNNMDEIKDLLSKKYPGFNKEAGLEFKQLAGEFECISTDSNDNFIVNGKVID